MPHLYCCIDVEASGPIPGINDLVSLGAVAVAADGEGRHAVLPGAPLLVEVAPQGGVIVPSAMAIHGISSEHLEAEGKPLEEAMTALSEWAETQKADPAQKLVFVGHNAPFDWAYINHSYVRSGLPNPFGWKALDTKALAMGVLGLDWFDTNKERLAEELPGLGVEDEATVHQADHDALYQARILCALLDHPRYTRDS